MNAQLKIKIAHIAAYYGAYCTYTENEKPRSGELNAALLSKLETGKVALSSLKIQRLTLSALSQQDAEKVAWLLGFPQHALIDRPDNVDYIRIFTDDEFFQINSNGSVSCNISRSIDLAGVLDYLRINCRIHLQGSLIDGNISSFDLFS